MATVFGRKQECEGGNGDRNNHVCTLVNRNSKFTVAFFY